MVLANQRRVKQLSGGKVGYIHIPDMGANGLREFIKWYYPQTRKEGLVVDVRANGGGNVSRMLIERLRRQLLGVNFARTRDYAATYPGQRLRRVRWPRFSMNIRRATATSSRTCSGRRS